jgi:hypothetical protein
VPVLLSGFANRILTKESIASRAGNRDAGELARDRPLGKRERLFVGHRADAVGELFSRLNDPLGQVLAGPSAKQATAF